MTVNKDLEVDKIAIIGGGIAGLTSLFELLNTKRDGSTSLVYSETKELVSYGISSEDRAFSEIDVFEQSNQVGGIWNPSYDAAETIDQEYLDSGRYNDPHVLRPKTKYPDQLKEGLHGLENPLLTPKTTDIPKPWAKSGIYPSLFSNVPERYLRNSFMPFQDDTNSGTKNPIAPLIDKEQIVDQVKDFVKDFDLLKYVRLNSEVVDITKDEKSGKWLLTIRESASGESNKWYTKSYDAVIVSNGHYSIPFIPYVDGLAEWNKKFPGSIIHSKSYRNDDLFKNKNVLFVGTGLSGIDLIQYAFPVAKKVYVARTPGKREVYEWLGNAATSEGIQARPRVKSINAKNKSITFNDDTVVQDIDIIVFSTGYHWHYPFLSETDTGVKVRPGRNGKIADSGSSVAGLYLNTFSIEDPTLAFVGVTITSIKWPSFELTASAIAGVWTNKSHLPSKEQQESLNRERIEKFGSGLEFHYYPWDSFKTIAVELAKYLPAKRSLKDILDEKHLQEDFEKSFVVAEQLFYKYKLGELKY